MIPVFPVRNGLAGSGRGPDTPVPFALVIDGIRETLAFRGLVQSIRVSNQAKVQLTSSLSGFGYIYAFGEEFGDLSVSGLTFAGDCRNPDAPLPDNGFEAVYNYYHQRKAANSALPVTIVLGKNTPLLCFLIAFEAHTNSQDAGVFQFTLTFKFLPKKKL
ncbi:MAG: hypothetical protein QW299_07280 [Candidatus Caldarchaeum sp.]